MSRRFLATITLATLTLASAAPIRAQGWDVNRQASGWAFQDVDGSLVFYDPVARTLRTWEKGRGLTASLPVAIPEPRGAAPVSRPASTAVLNPTSDYDAAATLLYGIPRRSPTQLAPAKRLPAESRKAPIGSEALPQRWVLDPFNRIWMVFDGQLAVLGADGKIELTIPLPAAVEDMAVERGGILILYRTMKPFLEKRDFTTGIVRWNFGDKSQVKEAAAQPLLVPLNRMALGRDGTIYIAEGSSLSFTVIEPTKGTAALGQSFITGRDAIAERAALGKVGRGPLLSWSVKDVLFSAFIPGQVRNCGAPESKGLLLARFDLHKGTLDWLPTSLAEGHRLVGLLESEAVFLAPQGGLAFTPIH